jgi:hypothetical protein
MLVAAPLLSVMAMTLPSRSGMSQVLLLVPPPS